MSNRFRIALAGCALAGLCSCATTQASGPASAPAWDVVDDSDMKRKAGVLNDGM